MDELWEAPAKVNLTLRIGRPLPSGMHPLESVVQTIGWIDRLRLTSADDDELVVEGADLPTDGDNLVWRAADAVWPKRPKGLRIRLGKDIPAGAGLGGGSSDAAAVIAALAPRAGLTASERSEAALRVGADVTFFLTGGTAVMRGVGERVERLDPFEGFVLAIAVPAFELSTPDVYRRWDLLEGPVGTPIPGRSLPPSLRHLEVVNDLTPAAIDLEPALGDLLADLSHRWERPAIMSGSGSAVFACFADIDEAGDAVDDLGDSLRAARAVGLRERGVALVDR